MPRKHVAIVAGETSGDQHVARVIEELKIHHDIAFSGIGGPKMKAAGVDLIFDLAKYSVTGITEVITHFTMIRQAFHKIKKHLMDKKPDLLILVDYPGFNLRLAKFAKKLNIKILYYISPQIWAWKKGRIKLIKEVVDMMAVILPFEKEIYQNAGVPVKFVGNPLTISTQPSMTKSQALHHFKLDPNKKTIALLPGSRLNEIKRLLPTMKQAVDELLTSHHDIQFTLPLAPSLDKRIIDEILGDTKQKISLINGQALDVMNCSDIVIVASGTASLECALLEKPMAIAYKASTLTYILASQLIKVKYLGLCNLLANSMIVPELLQSDYTKETLLNTIQDLLTNKAMVEAMHKNLNSVSQSLSKQSIDCSLADLVIEQLA